MAESVKALPNEIKELTEVREWDMRTIEGTQQFRILKAKSLPSIAMNGELVYEAIIPGQEELGEEIQRRFEENNNPT